MKTIAFLKGALEFRRAFTTRFEDLDLADAYDRGREFAHWVTCRRFEA